MSSGSASALRRQVLLSGTMLVAAVAGYGRRAYGACDATPPGSSTYVCSGSSATNTTTQAITANDASVSTVAGFGVNTAANNAITITGNGALSYTDTNASSLTAPTGYALSVRSGGDFLGTPGSVTIATNGALSSKYGIAARNYGAGAITVTANGNVTTTGRGIFALNNAGTDVSVTTGAGTTVSGYFGITANNYGTGAITITANGNVTGTSSSNGIEARIGHFGSLVGSDLTVTTGAGTTVSGGANGIYARNFGTGALAITANGNVTGTAGHGIYAWNYNAASNLTVTTGAGTTVSGIVGIGAVNNGTGAITITANGDVTGTGGTGITARNYNATGTNLTVTTGAGTTVSGATYGIYARNAGTGAITITANGNVTGTIGNGIVARNINVNGTDLSLTTGAGTTVSGVSYGIFARNAGAGALSVTTNGNVTGTVGIGIFARNFNATSTTLTVTTGAGTTVSGGIVGIYSRNDGAGALTITANGNVTGTGGNGIYVRNNVIGTALSVTTGAGTMVSGGQNGINARNYGTGALTIIANGDVTGTNRGINARNISATSTALSVTTGAGTTVSGYNGIYARNAGTGALTVTANGNVTGTNSEGIFARSTNVNSTALSVTTGTGTTVSGTSGIYARNYGTGALTITANGNVTGTGTVGYGILAQNINATGTNLTVTTGAGATVSGNITGIYAGNSGTGALAVTVAATGTVSGTSGFGIWAQGRPATVTVAGTVTGGGGTAIRFDQAGAFANRLDLVTGAVINGNVRGGLGTDTLGLSGTGSGSFNVGQLSSFEAVEKSDSGAWTLSGDNTGITAFSASGGGLIVNGNLSNAAFTVSGVTFGGAGTVGNTLVSGGTFRPGDGTAGSSMTVNGTLGLSATTTYLVNLNPATASFASVSGAATLGGATVNAIFANGSYISKQYTILTAGSVNGTFGTFINTNLPANFHDSLSYDATHAYLNLDLNFSTPASNTLNGNQNNVGNALINYFNSTGDIPLVFGGLTANGLSQASGQPGASTSQAGFAATGQFINGVFDGAFGDGPGQGGVLGFAQDGDEANAYAAKRKVSREAKDAYAAVTPRDRTPSFEARWNVWASVYGGNSRVNGDSSAGTNTTTSRIFGTVAGASYRFTPDTLAGFALGGAGSSFDVANGFGGGRADVFNMAVYAKHNFGSAYLAGLLGYSWQDTTTDRTVTISGTDRLHASFKAQALAARLEGGWRYATPFAGVTPYAALQTTTFYLPAYGETATSGSNTFALNYASKTVTATRSELGAKFDKAMLVQGGVFTLKAKTAWAHDWNTDRTATATFQTLPGATFTVNGAQPSANAALVSLGAEMKWHNGWTVAANVDGEFSRTTAGYAGKGSVRYAW